MLCGDSSLFDISWWSENTSTCSNTHAPWRMNSLPNLPACEISSLPGSLRSRAPENFPDFGPPSFFLFFFPFHFHDRSERATDKTSEKSRSSEDPGIPTRFQRGCIYMSAIFEIFGVHILILIIFLQSLRGNISLPSHLMCELTARLFVHYTFLFRNTQ